MGIPWSPELVCGGREEATFYLGIQNGGETHAAFKDLLEWKLCCQ